MRPYDSRKPLFSLHIPKCGGTSFTNVLRSWFWPGFHAHYIAHDQQGQMPGKPHPVKKILHWTGIRPLCIHGHFEDNAHVFDYYPGATQFITILRDPLEMQLSLYWDHRRRIREFGALYWKGKPVEMEFDGDLDRWVAERPCYLLPFFPFELTLDNFSKVLGKHFVHIGVMEKLQQSVDAFAKKLGKPKTQMPKLNLSPRNACPSPTAVSTFREKHPLEYAIYAWALEQNT